MFDNIGEKIKGLASGICVLGIVASVLGAIGLFTMDSYRMPSMELGIVVLVGGCICSWIGSWILYGFGELIQETSANRRINTEILNKLRNANPTSVSNDAWRCTKCNSINHRTQQHCAECGQKR